MNQAELTQLAERVGAENPRLTTLFALEFGDAVINVEVAELLATAYELRDAGFDRLGMVTAVDRTEAMTLVYRLQSRPLSAAVFLKTTVSREEPHVSSVFEVWPAADWQEREVFDLFGVVFEGHPNLKRILLPDDFEGHPLLKDYNDERLIRRPDYI